MMNRICLIIFLFISVKDSYSQEYQNKTALIIGNTNYEVGRLRNPINDATHLSDVLSSLGFKVITKYCKRNNL